MSRIDENNRESWPTALLVLAPISHAGSCHYARAVARMMREVDEERDTLKQRLAEAENRASIAEKEVEDLAALNKLKRDHIIQYHGARVVEENDRLRKVVESVADWDFVLAILRGDTSPGEGAAMMADALETALAALASHPTAEQQGDEAQETGGPYGMTFTGEQLGLTEDKRQSQSEWAHQMAEGIKKGVERHKQGEGEVPGGYVIRWFGGSNCWIAHVSDTEAGCIFPDGERRWAKEGEAEYLTRAAAIAACWAHKRRQEGTSEIPSAPKVSQDSPEGTEVSHDTPTKPTPPEGPFYDGKGNQYRLKYGEPRGRKADDSWLMAAGDDPTPIKPVRVTTGGVANRGKGWKRWIVERIPDEKPALSDAERARVLREAADHIGQMPIGRLSPRGLRANASLTLRGMAARAEKGGTCNG